MIQKKTQKTESELRVRPRVHSHGSQFLQDPSIKSSAWSLSSDAFPKASFTEQYGSMEFLAFTNVVLLNLDTIQKRQPD